MPIEYIGNEYLSVAISSLGAEIQSIVDKNGVERIWQGDKAFWTGRAPVLFPFAGGLRDGYYLYGGNKYEMPSHGFAHTSEFDLAEKSDQQVTFVLSKAQDNYPFQYELTVRFTLRGSALKVDYLVRNNGDTPMIYGIGAHEAYSIPEGVDHIALIFDKEETLRTSLLSGAQITGETEELTRNSKVLQLRTDYFRRDNTLVFQHINSRGVTMESDKRKERVRVDFDGFDNLLIWQKQRAGFIAIEPWTNPPEYVTSDHIFSHKPGMTRLAPGKQQIHSHTITFL